MRPDPDHIMGRIINVQHFCVDDGPGIRTTVFLKGCPLRCAWCHNPESQKTGFELSFRTDKCIACGICAAVCPSGVHELVDGVHTLHRERCAHCGICAQNCGADALGIEGVDSTLAALMEEILLDRVFYKRSGGVTVSGGEPLLQAEFTHRLLAACKEEGLHTCVETCGYGRAEDILTIAAYTDLFLFDYKLTDETSHRQYTGVSNETILANLDLLCRSGAEIVLRCPMIPGVNLCQSHYDGIIALAHKYPNISQIHLEPYHPLGIGKLRALGRTSAYERADFLEKEELEEVRDHIQKKVSIPVRIS